MLVEFNVLTKRLKLTPDEALTLASGLLRMNIEAALHASAHYLWMRNQLSDPMKKDTLINQLRDINSSDALDVAISRILDAETDSELIRTGIGGVDDAPGQDPKTEGDGSGM